MEEARLVEIHAKSWRESDALPLNMYQWFFQTLNNPVKLGPLRQGNREVIVTKVQGEFNSIEMQKDKSSVAKKVKGRFDAVKAIAKAYKTALENAATPSKQRACTAQARKKLK